MKSKIEAGEKFRLIDVREQMEFHTVLWMEGVELKTARDRLGDGCTS
ncbi:MAG: hypothetical protein IPG76_23110 [Acidobacteria bacterium]|nr:hypothetical protein [Acidobacteriota bacterium]